MPQFTDNPYGGPLEGAQQPATNPPVLNDIKTTKLLPSLQTLGATWARYQLEWAGIEKAVQGQTPQQGDNPNTAPSRVYYDWSLVDAYVAECNAAHINCVYVVQGEKYVDATNTKYLLPTWHMQVAACDPKAKKVLPVPADIATFVNDLTTRYNGVTVNPATGQPYGLFDAIELMNEGYDDDNAIATCRDGEMAAVLCHYCYDTIKANTNGKTLVGVAAVYSAGGRTASDVTTWMQDFYGANNLGNGTISGKGKYDYFNIHYYAPQPAEIIPTGGGTNAPGIWNAMNAVMTVQGDGTMPIWFECGYTMLNAKGTNGGITDQTYSDYLFGGSSTGTTYQGIYNLARDSGAVAKVMLYNVPSIVGTNSTGTQITANNYIHFVTNNPASSWKFYQNQSGGGGNPVAQLSTTALSFQGNVNGSNPNPQSITLTNKGTGSGTYVTPAVSYSSGASGWLTITPASGTLAVNASVQQSFVITLNGLGQGTYTATVPLGFSTSNTSVTVTLTVSQPASTAGKLPGQQIINGVSNYIFGYNTPNYNTALLTNTGVQQQMKSSGFSVIRTSVNDNNGVNYTNQQLDTLMSAITAAGAVPLVILRESDPTFDSHVVSYLGNRCNLYELGNEPDINGISVSQYSAVWNQVIPAARNINPNAAYIGPVLGVFDNYQSYLLPWLQNCINSGVLPDGISYHVYPCTSQSPIPEGSFPNPAPNTCASYASNIGQCGTTILTAVTQMLNQHGITKIPAICCTEWNIDAWYSNSTTDPNQPSQTYSKNTQANAPFISGFTVSTIDSMVQNNIDLACEFELNYYLVDDNNPTSNTQTQYTAMQQELQKYLSSGTGTQGTLSASPSSLAFTCVQGTNPVTQQVTLSNSGSSSISYTANSEVNYVTISPGAGTIAGNGTGTLTIGGNVAALPAGVYDGNIVVIWNGSNLTINFSITVTSSTGTPTLSVSPASLAFASMTGQSSPVPQSVTLTNTGTAQGSWTVSFSYQNGTGYLSTSVQSGTLAPNATQTVSVLCTTSTLTTGLYQATLLFTLKASSVNVPVTLMMSTPAGSGTAMQQVGMRFSLELAGTQGGTLNTYYGGTGVGFPANPGLPPSGPVYYASGRVPIIPVAPIPFGIGTYQPVNGTGNAYGNGFPEQAGNSEVDVPASGLYGGTYGYVLDTTIRRPQQVQYVPVPLLSLDGAGKAVIRGYPGMVWVYNELRPDYWYYFQRLWQQSARAPMGFASLVLLQYPDPQGSGTAIQQLARWDPIITAGRNVGVYLGVQLVFKYLGQAKLTANVPVVVISATPDQMGHG